LNFGTQKKVANFIGKEGIYCIHWLNNVWLCSFHCIALKRHLMKLIICRWIHCLRKWWWYVVPIWKRFGYKYGTCIFLSNLFRTLCIFLYDLFRTLIKPYFPTQLSFACRVICV
jgi:hypothetical protein